MNLAPSSLILSEYFSKFKSFIIEKDSGEIQSNNLKRILIL